MPRVHLLSAPHAAAAALALTALMLTGCAADATPQGEGSAPGPTTPAASASATPVATATPTPDPSSTSGALPTDCRAILGDDVLDQLEGVPLNDPAFSPTGVQPDGTLICVWGDPTADTTGMTTTISRVYRGDALDLLNGLADDGYTCYQPDEGTRCEKTWKNDTYPVTDGRTLYWRDDTLVDTQYSNMMIDGYTASIAAHLFG
ncbi:hypothetical protein ACFQRL_00580 [Microbacterium fluvii]|uniref:DUF3558 domain-containing protein n=1 Tax=Microbacterium fluvii TaxID=415215 RepID=A0ABW2H9D5_9MICO|nr:hypothetical protein [Microbacterium fluvii]MCU4671081.1 hypothetical protein [Microbacterium fluvii]